MRFLFNWMIFRFHVNFQRGYCIMFYLARCDKVSLQEFVAAAELIDDLHIDARG